MDDSNVRGVSIRAVLALIIVVCCCGLAVWIKDIGILKDLALVAVSFYFGQKSITNQNGAYKNGNGEASGLKSSNSGSVN